MSASRGKRFIPGIELKRPQNVGKYDAVLCGQLIMMAGPEIRLKCEKPMQIMKVIDSGLQLRSKTLQCNGWGGHPVQSNQLYVAVCHGKEHLNGQPHVVCSICIENYKVYSGLMDPNYSIVENYYEYKPKKK